MKPGPERELVARYLERARMAGKPLALTDFSVLESPESRAGSAASRKTDEARALSSALPDGCVRVAMDEHGKSLSSEELAAWVANQRDAGASSLGFLIGGADGLDPGLVSGAARTISFSPLTWPHQLVRIMLAEQLYRTTTILNGHPYHRGD